MPALLSLSLFSSDEISYLIMHIVPHFQLASSVLIWGYTDVLMCVACTVFWVVPILHIHTKVHYINRVTLKFLFEFLAFGTSLGLRSDCLNP